MISYATNWMGPINRKWIIKHGGHWSAGRIDIYVADEDYPREVGLPPMHSDDWRRFSGWLDKLKTAEVWGLDRLVAEYEKTNPPIRWHKKKTMTFGDWWNSEIDDSENPYRKDSPVYWAYAGWIARGKVS